MKMDEASIFDRLQHYGFSYPSGFLEGYFQKSEGCESWNCQHLHKKIVDYVCSILCRDERGIR